MYAIVLKNHPSGYNYYLKNIVDGYSNWTMDVVYAKRYPWAHIAENELLWDVNTDFENPIIEIEEI